MLNPTISLSSSTFSSNQEITGTVSLYNRPDYHGKPAISGLTTITPAIVCSRVPTGQSPFHIMVSARETTANTGIPYTDLHYEWNFGDSSGVETFIDQYNGQTVNANNSQQGPEAAYIYRNAGTYTVTLTVKGKDENGTLITASTTSIKTIGSYYVFKGQATGGSYSLTINGETASGIAYNAGNSTVETALRALPSLDSTNCVVDHNGNIEFIGNLAGTTISMSGNFTTLTGNTGSGVVRADVSSTTSSGVTVSSAGWTSQYFDSNYSGASGASDGTINRPYTSWSNVESFISTTTQTLNKKVYLKRGSTFNFGNQINYDRGNKGVRILAYGSGAKPILNSTFSGHIFSFEQNWSSASVPVRLGGDFVFSDLDIRRNVPDAVFQALLTTNDDPNYPYSSYSNLVWDNCDYIQSTSGNAMFLNFQTTQTRGIGLHGIHMWNCNANMTTGAKHVAFMAPNKWVSIVGGFMASGVGDLVLDHHIYADCKGHQLYRYIDFQNATKSFCLNINAKNDGGVVPYCVVDGCDVTGTQNGIDLSNTANDTSLTGMIDYITIQFNKIHVGQAGTQKLGLYGNNHRYMSVRYNDFWDNTGSNIQLNDYRLRLNLYNNNFYNGQCLFRNGSQIYSRYNSFYSDSSYYLIHYNGTPSFDSDYNIYYSPSASPFRRDDSTNVSYATWQGSGFDPNGQNVNTNFYLPQSGIFVKNPKVKVNWPSSFNTFEVYQSGVWVPYTNDSYLIIGGGINSRQTIDFKALSGTEGGNKTVYTYSSGDTILLTQESDYADLIGYINRYYTFGFGGGLLVFGGS